MRLLKAMEMLFSIDEVELLPALKQAALAVTGVLEADAVDVLLYQPENNSLEALSVTDSPMGRRQLGIGMDRMQLVNRGLAVDVFESGQPKATGHADQEEREIPGIYSGLGARSELIAPMDVAGARRGVVQVLSAQEECFEPENDLPFVEAVARWIGVVTHRAELIHDRAHRIPDPDPRKEGVLLGSLLTRRQWEIAGLISAGMTNDQIGERLCITPGAVGNHIKRIRERIGAVRRSQLAAWYVLDGFDSAPEERVGAPEGVAG
jgi:DNA-binding CsgD family transcriptional regulator